MIDYFLALWLARIQPSAKIERYIYLHVTNEVNFLYIGVKIDCPMKYCNNQFVAFGSKLKYLL